MKMHVLEIYSYYTIQLAKCSYIPVQYFCDHELEDSIAVIDSDFQTSFLENFR